MILTQLKDDYERILRYGVVVHEDDENDEDDGEPISLAPPSMYAAKPVRWQIELSRQGTFRQFQKLSGAGGKGKDRGKSLLVPFAVRTVNVRPLLLADTPAYVLGLETDAKNAARKHAAFRALVERCAQETQDAGVQAVADFLHTWDATPEGERPALPADLGASDTLIFEVSGEYPMDAPAARAFWAQVCGEEIRASAATQCLVCGELRPAVENMPLPVKGIPGGQTSGTFLVSANSEVYESHGMKRAATSPICAPCAEQSGKALNLLLANDRTRKRIGSLVYVFWTSRGECEAARQISNAQVRPEYVRALIESVREGKRRELDDAKFYGLMLSATAARAVVRDWLTTTVGRVNANVAHWFEMQEDVPDTYGNAGNPVADWVLAASLYRQKAPHRMNTEDVEARVSALITRAALHGSPLPEDLLNRAVQRNRAENNVTYERAVLMTVVLRSNGELRDAATGDPARTQEALTLTQQTDERAQMEQAIRERNRKAEQCGKLLAVLEELQSAFARSEGRTIKATLVDRYYGSASSAPATVFGTLLADAQAHLTKLRKNSRGAFENLQSQLEQVMGDLDTFPTTLNMKQQAHFSLGYYHQRAAIRADRAAGTEAKRQKETRSANASATHNDADDSSSEDN